MSDILQIAQTHIERWKRETPAAEECCACEQFLQKGICAQQWLRNAEATIREATKLGIDIEMDIDAPQALATLHEAWLIPCQVADAWISRLANDGHIPENKHEFKKAKDSVLRWLKGRATLDAIDDAFEGVVFDESVSREAARSRQCGFETLDLIEIPYVDANPT